MANRRPWYSVGDYEDDGADLEPRRRRRTDNVSAMDVVEETPMARTARINFLLRYEYVPNRARQHTASRTYDWADRLRERQNTIRREAGTSQHINAIVSSIAYPSREQKANYAIVSELYDVIVKFRDDPVGVGKLVQKIIYGQVADDVLRERLKALWEDCCVPDADVARESEGALPQDEARVLLFNGLHLVRNIVSQALTRHYEIEKITINRGAPRQGHAAPAA